MVSLRALGAGAALLALASAPAAAKKEGSSYDPNRQICKSRATIGSRLTRVRECHSAQQWEELKRSEQLGLMRQQINGKPDDKPVMDGGRDTPW